MALICLLKRKIVAQFKLCINSIHGIKHWKNVERIGKYLTKRNGADFEIVRLFAYLHDSKRENDDHDSEHGLRASKFVKKLYGKKLLNISEKQLEQLIFACKHHSNPSAKNDNATIQTCWDADRLDFWRLGERPEKDLLYTDIAKQDKTIEFARKINLCN